MSPPSDPPAIMALLVMVLIGHSTLPFRMHIASRLKGGKRFEELRHLVPLATQRMLKWVSPRSRLAPSGPLICNQGIRLAVPIQRGQIATRKVSYEIDEGFIGRSGCGRYSGARTYRRVRARWRRRRARWRRWARGWRGLPFRWGARAGLLRASAS